MLDVKVQFTCSNCTETVEVRLEDVETIFHRASWCGCEYCGWSEWKEYKTSCPNCNKEVSTI